jgi:hypothetical protein
MPYYDAIVAVHHSLSTKALSQCLKLIHHRWCRLGRGHLASNAVPLALRHGITTPLLFQWNGVLRPLPLLQLRALARYRRMKNGNALDLPVQHEHKGATRREKEANSIGSAGACDRHTSTSMVCWRVTELEQAHLQKFQQARLPPSGFCTDQVLCSCIVDGIVDV